MMIMRFCYSRQPLRGLDPASLACEGSITWGFSRVMGNCSCSSAAKLAIGDSVPLVSRMLLTCFLASICIASPGRKHLKVWCLSA